MNKIREFRQHAAECRKSAAQALTAELRSHYEELAGIWEKLANERLAFSTAVATRVPAEVHRMTTAPQPC
jgi:hypothetical protein